LLPGVGGGFVQILRVNKN